MCYILCFALHFQLYFFFYRFTASYPLDGKYSSIKHLMIYDSIISRVDPWTMCDWTTHGSTYWIFFSTYIGKLFGDLQNKRKQSYEPHNLEIAKNIKKKLDMLWMHKIYVDTSLSFTTMKHTCLLQNIKIHHNFIKLKKFDLIKKFDKIYQNTQTYCIWHYSQLREM